MNIPKNFWNTLIGFLGILIALAAVVLIKQVKSIAYVGSGIQPTNTISVDGTGDAYAVPDVATFSFTVTDTEKVVADAQTKVTTKIAAVKQAIASLGIEDKDVQTTYYSINPHYEYQSAICPQPAVYNGTVSSGSSVSSIAYCPPSKQTITGYDVSESETVKLHDTTKAGTLLASLGSLNVDNLNGPSFEVDNPDTVQSQARALAITDAQSKANDLAKQLGVRLVRIVSFTENNGNYPQPMMYTLGAAKADSTAAATPDVSAGQQKVTDDVSITYEIQ